MKLKTENPKLITILGPTATGKTTLAANLASQIDGEVISADSRQVYRGMDIGTGKDLQDFNIAGKIIPYHLIDIVEAGYEYNVYEYLKDFRKVYEENISRNKKTILCGGSGLYIEAVLKGYKLTDTPVDNEFRKKINTKTDVELIKMLSEYRNMHNTTDTTSRERLIRALEIAYYNSIQTNETEFQKTESDVFGIYFERDIIKKRITERLKKRLESGMIYEVKNLIEKGVSADKLKYYGLEYKFITQYISGETGYNEMFEKLNIAIHQFAKRQMTWFRKMEKNGIKINWIDGNLSIEEKIKQICHRFTD
ncbi:MAG: tRNA (adenosine(37)-N6)-dimethylallyltransferase MiaA [Bacteroidales bacterium]|nr:tRNA (adenosine(37)-N6)-dimethylallyltransferase MiaA [Bacteroidales bacterium]